MVHFKTIIPDEYEEAYDEFIKKWERRIDKEKVKSAYRVVPFDKDKQ